MMLTFARILELLAIAALTIAMTAKPAAAIDCQQIRKAVEVFGYEAAIKWAREHGYSNKTVNFVRVTCRIVVTPNSSVNSK